MHKTLGSVILIGAVFTGCMTAASVSGGARRQCLRSRGDDAAIGVVQTGIGGGFTAASLGGIGTGAFMLGTAEDSASKTPGFVALAAGVVALGIGSFMLMSGMGTVSAAVATPCDGDEFSSEKPALVARDRPRGPPPTQQSEVSAACKACPEQCASLKASCDQGNMADCHKAGVCACRCKIDAGGCGEDFNALSTCAAGRGGGSP